MRVGLVSDTHGLFDESLTELLAGAEVILHAGDVCGAHVLEALARIAPVRAIHGNCDGPPLSRALPASRTEALDGWRVLLLHDLGKPGRPRPAAARLLQRERPDICIAGHSHQGSIETRDGLLFVNPGSAGRKRFSLLRSCAVLELTAASARVQVLSLEAPVGRIVHAGSVLKKAKGPGAFSPRPHANSSPSRA